MTMLSMEMVTRLVVVIYYLNRSQNKLTTSTTRERGRKTKIKIQEISIFRVFVWIFFLHIKSDSLSSTLFSSLHFFFTFHPVQFSYIFFRKLFNVVWCACVHCFMIKREKTGEIFRFVFIFIQIAKLS